MRYLVIAIATLMVGCPQPSPAPMPPDATDAAPPLGDAGPVTCVSTCAHLRDLGCAEGLAASCEATCTHVQVARQTDLKMGCLGAAKTKADAHACGSVDCP